ncbi:MAG: hypothetical protein JNL83_32560 [Myxococcales bacterium]|nr:hypothetical protein [Myxococcales bacterium]
MVGRWWLAAVALCAACADDPVADRAPERAPPARPVAGPTALPEPPHEETIGLRVLSPGAEPRRLLRYRPRPGDEQTIVLETGMDMAMTAGGHRMLAQQGTTEGRVVLRVERVDGERITVKVDVIELKAPSYDPTNFTKPESLANQQGTFVMSDRGRLLETNLPFIETSELAREAFQLTDYLMLLPEEPVGRGARWEVHSRMQRNGLGLQSVDTHELVELSPTSGRTRATLAQGSWPQLVTSYADDPVTMFEMVAFRSTGSGDLTFSLERPLPTDATTTFDFTADMRIRRLDGTQTTTYAITMTYDAKLRVTEDRGGRAR